MDDTCPTCDGYKCVTYFIPCTCPVRDMPGWSGERCPVCYGTGHVEVETTDLCPTCKGSGVVDG